jgi:hypothetical protein
MRIEAVEVIEAAEVPDATKKNQCVCKVHALF